MTEDAGTPIDVSVVIPARNATPTIGEQLDALEGQTFSGSWEVIVVDNGSVDGTAETAARWSDRLPSLSILTSAESRGLACNTGSHAAKGRLIAYCDADDVVSKRWLADLVPVLERHTLATGPIDLSSLNPPKLYTWRRKPGWQQLPRWMGFLVPVMGCNMGVRKEGFARVGGFDTTMSRGEDFDFAWRIQLAGGTVGFAADAVVHRRLRRGWPYFRSSVHYGVSDVELFLRFNEHGMRRRPVRGAARLGAAALGTPLILIPRYRYAWMGLAGVEAGRLKGSFSARTLFL
ncbi:MAG: glycosyltransferase [Acidimicrobiales bacterium]